MKLLEHLPQTTDPSGFLFPSSGPRMNPQSGHTTSKLSDSAARSSFLYSGVIGILGLPIRLLGFRCIYTFRARQPPMSNTGTPNMYIAAAVLKRIDLAGAKL